ncbi:MAG: hypothetical protein JWP97_351 [Labilithrix sp.]|nr:hypothetical protein [Labilithrix sp.]
MTPRSAARLVVPIALLAGTLAACTLTTSLDGLAGPELAPDAGADVGPLVDTGADAPPPPDAAVDAADARPPTFCETLVPAPTFCDDFERTDVKGGWDAVQTSDTGKVLIGAVPAGGHELVTTQPAFTMGVASARVERKVSVPNTLRYAAQLAFEAPLAEGYMQVMSSLVYQAGTSDFEAVFLMVRPSGAFLAVQTFPGGQPATYVEYPLAGLLPTGAARSTALDLTLSGTPRLRYTVEGQIAVDVALPALFRPGAVIIDAGIHFGEGPAGALTLHIDDVVIDAK